MDHVVNEVRTRLAVKNDIIFGDDIALAVDVSTPDVAMIQAFGNYNLDINLGKTKRMFGVHEKKATFS